MDHLMMFSWRKAPVMGRNQIVRLLLFVLLAGPVVSVFADVSDAIDRSAIKSHLGAQSTLLSVNYAGNRLVAVGERGLILLSDDQGHTWRQAPSPVSVTLTGVQIANAQVGYVIGHGGIVMRTDDAGEHWKKLLNGRQLANQLYTQAEKSGDDNAIHQAKLLVADGPDKPFLDLLVLSPEHLIVVGAYGFVFESSDGGASWQSWMGRIDNPMGLHLYSIRKHANRILIAGEQGFIALSNDNGKTFETLNSPYEGSFFTAQLQGDNRIILAGLRGNAFVSNDNGKRWDKINNSVQASITASLETPKGEVLMVNQAGMVLLLLSDRLVPATSQSFPPLTYILEKAQGGVLALSIHGPVSIALGNVK